MNIQLSWSWDCKSTCVTNHRISAELYSHKKTTFSCKIRNADHGLWYRPYILSTFHHFDFRLLGEVSKNVWAEFKFHISWFPGAPTANKEPRWRLCQHRWPLSSSSPQMTSWCLMIMWAQHRDVFKCELSSSCWRLPHCSHRQCSSSLAAARDQGWAMNIIQIQYWYTNTNTININMKHKYE